MASQVMYSSFVGTMIFKSLRTFTPTFAMLVGPFVGVEQQIN